MNFEVLSSRLNLPPPLIHGLSGLALSSSSPFLSLLCHPSFPSLSRSLPFFFRDTLRGQKLHLQVKNSSRTRRAGLTITDREGESLGHTPHKCVSTHTCTRPHTLTHSGVYQLSNTPILWSRRYLRADLQSEVLKVFGRLSCPSRYFKNDLK